CRFGRQLYELRCDCHWQSIDFDSLRGAPPPGEAMGAAAPIRYTTVNALTKADSLIFELLQKNPPAISFLMVGGFVSLRQHRTMGAAGFDGSFTPIAQYEKWEIHTVFPHFSHFRLG
ncbi:MAG: hypothetical protein MR426_04495, partial [Clostridiales bacterium]|nr:hypothetical protein [Clostridiales bacterium]